MNSMATDPKKDKIRSEYYRPPTFSDSPKSSIIGENGEIKGKKGNGFWAVTSRQRKGRLGTAICERPRTDCSNYFFIIQSAKNPW